MKAFVLGFLSLVSLSVLAVDQNKCDLDRWWGSREKQVQKFCSVEHLSKEEYSVCTGRFYCLIDLKELAVDKYCRKVDYAVARAQNAAYLKYGQEMKECEGREKTDPLRETCQEDLRKKTTIVMGESLEIDTKTIPSCAWIHSSR